MEYNFLSSWSIERKEKREKRNFKIIISILLCFCIAISIKTLFDFKLMKNKNDTLNNKIQDYSNKNIKVSNDYSNKDSNTLKVLEDFIIDFDKNINYNNIQIDSSGINLEIMVKDEKDYINKIKIIENNKKYNIKSISPIIKDGNKHLFKAELEVI